MDPRTITEDFVRQAIGRGHRDDPRLEATGGPAGNARLTAWTGLLLLVLFLAELVTLLDVRSWIGWHVVIGVLLIPPALLKTATTSWRIARYYSGNRPYRQAGPPVLALRVLGPLVVASTLAVLGTGVALILVSPDSARSGLVAGFSLLMLHKASFVIWGVATGVHTLGRLIPALQLTVARAARVPGRWVRTSLLALTVAVAVVASLIALSAIGPWRASNDFGGNDKHHVHLQPH